MTRNKQKQITDMIRDERQLHASLFFAGLAGLFAVPDNLVLSTELIM